MPKHSMHLWWCHDTVTGHSKKWRCPHGVCSQRNSSAFRSVETAECFRSCKIHPTRHCCNSSCAGSTEGVPVKRGKVMCLLREGKSCEFATAVKHCLQQPKEHYHSFHPWPPPFCIKKKTFHLAAQFSSLFVSFSTVQREGDGFLNSSTRVFMEQIAVKSYIWLLPGFQQRECCVYSTKLRHKTTSSLDTALTGRECEF